MLIKFFAITLLLLGALVSCQIGVTPCPITNHNGTVISGTIIVSANGIIPLIDGQDSQCYNYSLPYAFTKVP